MLHHHHMNYEGTKHTVGYTREGSIVTITQKQVIDLNDKITKIVNDITEKIQLTNNK